MLFFFVSIVAGSLASMGSSMSLVTPTPLPTSVGDDIFPQGLICSDIVMNEGPTWRGITIGKTTLTDLEELLEAGETVIPYRGDMWRFEMLDFYHLPYQITACIQNETIVAMKIGGLFTPLWIDDFIAMYGVPDAVTYTRGSSERIALWFERGVAATVFIHENTNAYGLVGSFIYFPYQPVEGYETRWPYNRTLQEGVPSMDQDVSNEQNPFDFNAMVATITAQPLRTPTPTFTPQPTQSTTPMPGPTSTPD